MQFLLTLNLQHIRFFQVRFTRSIHPRGEQIEFIRINVPSAGEYNLE